MAEPRVALYPGTFDPVTNGHMDIISRAAGIVDRLIVAVAANAGKGPLFSLDERAKLLQGEIQEMPAALRGRVEVKPFNSLLMHFAQSVGANVIVRGLRAVSDFEYEFQMAGMNRKMNPSVETVFLMASETNQFISSRFVKEIARLGGDISHFVSPRIVRRVSAMMAQNGGTGNAADANNPTIPVPDIRSPI
jgi:pantetheine-phosphate adenylyltransferase